MNLYIINHNRI